MISSTFLSQGFMKWWWQRSFVSTIENRSTDYAKTFVWAGLSSNMIEVIVTLVNFANVDLLVLPASGSIWTPSLVVHKFYLYTMEILCITLAILAANKRPRYPQAPTHPFPPFELALWADKCSEVCQILDWKKQKHLVKSIGGCCTFYVVLW